MTGLHVPGVNLHPASAAEQLRTALREYDGAARHRKPYMAAAVLAAARELLAELDTEQGDEPMCPECGGYTGHHDGCPHKSSHVCWVDDSLCPNCGGK